MARTINEQEYAKKRNEILDTAQRLIHVKGYERMTIQDILNELQISSGAFYHYFGSKPAVLEAFIERIREETEKPLLPIIRDPKLSAIEKLQGFFDTLDRLRSENRAAVLKLGRVWYADENAIVRQKVEEAVREQRAPLLTEIVRQGVREGVFTTAYPEQSGEVILSLQQGMGNTHAKLLLSLEKEQDPQNCMERITVTYAAYMDAIERVLGAPSNALYRLDAEAVKAWVTAED
ncbi:TetR/AcrR family transcriptional regulator [Paenibacillus sp. MSJ-34]|uniref:TetR/AcrR family transcriptional regulator n=1 Tax=Paenibacillus sp. MSJ-34 TaxID=2841529 RepID=UPI001C10EECF|nr:TetR/AcrR family transcriptional regulator [Paenibacillus sp. MSJ-34]MBU5444741.1 TetR/AcrR family transcriptional regulator [Paenibacillus sp. MSJ-34]